MAPWLETKVASPRERRAKVSDSSVNRELTLLRAMLNYASDVWDHKIPKIDWKAQWLKEPPWRDRYLTIEEYQELLDGCHTSLRPIVIFAVNTGLRLNNIKTLTWRQVDFAARRINVLLKGNKRHTIRMSQTIIALLSSMDRDRGRVFDFRNFRKRWASALKTSGVEDFRFHDLRHTFATWMVQNGVPLERVMKWMGHSDISQTMRYAHHAPQSEGDDFAILDGITAHFKTHSEVKH